MIAMNDQQFAEWLDYHRKAYPALERWLAENSVIGFWKQTLSATSLKAACWATDRLAQGDATANGFGEHARVIKSVARDYSGTPRPKYYDYERAYKCLTCEDRGLIDVWTPLYLRFFLWGWVNHGYGVPKTWKHGEEWKTAKSQDVLYAWMRHGRGQRVKTPCKLRGQEAYLVACECDTGAKFTEPVERKGIVISAAYMPYDPSCMCLYNRGDVEKVSQWLSTAVPVEQVMD